MYNVCQIFGIEKPDLMALGNSKEIKEYEEYYKYDKAVYAERKKEKCKKRIRLGPSSYKEGRWTADEHENFVRSCLIHGNNWRQVNLNL
jgi:hypothetical protein